MVFEDRLQKELAQIEQRRNALLTENEIVQRCDKI